MNSCAGMTKCSAKALRVAPQGADYKSMHAAVDAARSGAEIVVDSGTYTESLWSAKPRLTLRSTTRHGAKIVAPPKRDAIGLGGGANDITLDGFDITAPGGNGIQTNRTGIEHVLNHHTNVRMGIRCAGQLRPAAVGNPVTGFFPG
jgi:pectin methylesterase-like acyl-CoA thioesterase